MKTHLCLNCGGSLKQTPEGFACPYCRSIYEIDAEERGAAMLESLLDEEKAESYARAKRVLYKATHAKYPSSEEVLDAARKVLAIEEKDVLANVYLFSHDADPHRLNAYLPGLTVTHAEAEEIVRWLLPSLQVRSGPALLRFVERNFRDEELTKYLNEVEEMVHRLDEGVYEAGLLRDVFVAYSSADSKEVIHLVDVLEENGLNCFLALRNLRHGQGAADNYLRLIKEAMAACRVFLFLSTPNSLSATCDAIRVEIPHLIKALPEKARFQYVLSECDRVPLLVARTLKDAFPEDAVIRDEEELLTRIFDLIQGAEMPASAFKPASSRKPEPVPMPSEPEPDGEPLPDTGEEDAELERMQRELEQERTRLEQERTRLEQECAELARDITGGGARKREVPATDWSHWPVLDRGQSKPCIHAPSLAPNAPHDNVATYVKRGVTEIPDDAFGFAYSTVVHVPDTVTAIATTAFRRNRASDKEPTITEIVVVPENGHFASRDGILYDKNFTEVLFCPQTKSGNVTLPNTVKRIGKEAFFGCRFITGIELPPGLERIEANAFFQCNALTALNIPAKVAFIDDSALRGLPADIEITVSGKNPNFHVRDGVIHKAKPETKPQATKVVQGDREFASLDGILYSTDLTRLVSCPKTKSGSVRIPETVKRIEDDAFRDCRSITAIELPSGLERIGSKAFFGCDGIQSFRIPNGSLTIYGTTFSGMKSFSEFTVAPNDRYHVAGGVLYDDEKHSAIAYPAARKDRVVTLEEGTLSVDWDAFADNVYVEEVLLPESVHEIGGGAFRGCAGLRSVNIPEKTTIRGSAFQGCVKLKVDLPWSTEVAAWAFEGGKGKIIIHRRISEYDHGMAFAGFEGKIVEKR